MVYNEVQKKVTKIFMTAIFAFCMFYGCTVAYAEMLDKVIAVINDEVLTQREFDRAFVSVKQSYEKKFKGQELARRLETARKGLLEQLINSKLAVSIAKKEEIKIDEEELKTKVKKIESYYGSEEVFLQSLNDQGTNLSEFEAEMRDQMLAQKLVEKEVTSRIVVSPSDVKDLYEKNKEKFVAPSRVKVRGIMVRKPEPSAGADVSEEETAARKKIDEIVAELKEGKDFAAVATERSEGPYASNGGDMGYIVPGQVLKEMDKAIFALKQGETSDIVETEIGYHIFLAEEVQEQHDLSLDEVSDYLENQLFMRRFQESMVRWLKEKRKNAYIDYK